jgi:hypothetical protein
MNNKKIKIKKKKEQVLEGNGSSWTRHTVLAEAEKVWLFWKQSGSSSKG